MLDYIAPNVGYFMLSGNISDICESGKFSKCSWCKKRTSSRAVKKNVTTEESSVVLLNGSKVDHLFAAA